MKVETIGPNKLLLNRYRIPVVSFYLCGILLLLHLRPASGADVTVSLSSGIPSSLLLGLFENRGKTWMKESNVPWNARYCYLTKGWVDNWGWGEKDGSYALAYMKECDELHTVPVIQYYQVTGEDGGGEDQFLEKVQTVATMTSYFGDFKLLMERAADFGKPVYILLEADGFGYLEIQSSNNPDAGAAVASTGLAELSGLPNTIAGWGQAFLALKKAAGASNALLGIHISGWASEQDLFYYSVELPLQPEVDKVYSFLAPLGLTPNATGLTWDVLVGDPLDRDADFYRLVNGDGGKHWWDTAADASVNSRSFNRYREWLHLWNRKSGKPWVLWQIPLGNSNHLNVTNTGQPREGYKDNRPEYFLGDGGIERTQRFADAGVIALLFGAGASGVSSYENDQYTDGELFMQSRAAAFFAAGGIPLEENVVKLPDHRGFRIAPLSTGSVTAERFNILGRRIAKSTTADFLIQSAPGITIIRTRDTRLLLPFPAVQLR